MTRPEITVESIGEISQSGIEALAKLLIELAEAKEVSTAARDGQSGRPF